MLKILSVFIILIWSAIAQAQTCIQADLTHPLQVAVTWADTNTAETGSILERSLNGGAFTIVAPQIPANATSYTDLTVARSTVPNTYVYRLKAFSTAGTGSQSPYSNAPCITFAPLPIPPPVLQAPGGLTLAAISSSSLRATWEDLVGESGYELEGKQSRGNDPFVLIASLPPDNVVFDWTGRKRFTPYCVRARSRDPGSSYSLVACGTTSK